MSILIFLHITAGTIGIISGLIAPFTRKGQKMHKFMGLAFFASMLVLGTSGSTVACIREIPLSFLNGLLISYFVVSSFNVIKQKPTSINYVDKSLAVLAIVVTVGFFYYAMQAFKTPNGQLGGFSGIAYIAFGLVALICTLSDVRFLLKKGLAGKERVVRHLWRMFFPLFMSTAAFFLGQAKLFPEALRKTELLVIPVACVVFAMVAWIIIVAFGQRYAYRNRS